MTQETSRKLNQATKQRDERIEKQKLMLYNSNTILTFMNNNEKLYDTKRTITKKN